jgi:hypothetical protein
MTEQQTIQAFTAIINLLVKITKASQCNTNQLAGEIKREISELQPPFANGIAEMILQKYVERIESPDVPAWRH